MATGIIWMEMADDMNPSSVRKVADWYYYDEEGHLVLNRDMKIGKYRYIFQNNGAAYRGLKTENGKSDRFYPVGPTGI